MHMIFDHNDFELGLGGLFLFLHLLFFSVRPLQLVYMFLVRHPLRSRPPSVNILCIARMTCGAIPN